jgi:hypothetical protein
VLDLGRHRDYADMFGAASANGVLSAGFSACSPAECSA